MTQHVDPEWVHRTATILRPDPSRVVSRIFLPGQEALQPGGSRSTVILERVLDLSDDEVETELAGVRAAFAHRHRDLEDTWARHFALVEHRLAGADRPAASRRRLIGAYFTQEFGVEAAALFNPSMVRHPDQSGMPLDSTRFVMTVRAVGEGHISSVEFRTGTIDGTQRVAIDEPAKVAVLPSLIPTRYSRLSFRQQLTDVGETGANADFVLGGLPDSFSRSDLDFALNRLRDQRVTRGAAVRTIERLERIADCSYSVEFPDDSSIEERVLMPTAPSESHGMEDVRLLQFTENDGRTRFIGTYTAHDGHKIASQLIGTDDFRTFDVTQLSGPGSQNKGMAVFPRRIGDDYVALSRADRESNGVTTSHDLRHWDEPILIQTPHQPWEIVQLGNCGPPVETDAGWVVLTHGVGPMRQYGIGALLLDLDDPTVVLGRLAAPLLTPAPDERDGYVPNVVYSCGAMLHGQTLVLPYGCSDSTTRIALVDLEPLLDALTHDTPLKETT
jgi:predicted GH43/DUF377 family glycosyl hydrolase